jgi:hypothetical protein
VRAEGIATERDRARVRKAAELLVAGDHHALAGEALETIHDHVAAANAYSAGGLVEMSADPRPGRPRPDLCWRDLAGAHCTVST